MSELKAYIAPTADRTGLADYYLKSEADKVIADLEESHKKEVEQLLMEIAELKKRIQFLQVTAICKDCNKCADGMGKVFDETLNELKAQKAQAEDDCAYWKAKAQRERHHKFKRCLAMAMWCEAENYTACWYHENSERCEWTEKWHERWLALAEKFNPNNSTAQ